MSSSSFTRAQRGTRPQIGHHRGRPALQRGRGRFQPAHDREQIRAIFGVHRRLGHVELLGRAACRRAAGRPAPGPAPRCSRDPARGWRRPRSGRAAARAMARSRVLEKAPQARAPGFAQQGGRVDPHDLVGGQRAAACPVHAGQHHGRAQPLDGRREQRAARAVLLRRRRRGRRQQARAERQERPGANRRASRAHHDTPTRRQAEPSTRPPGSILAPADERVSPRLAGRRPGVRRLPLLEEQRRRPRRRAWAAAPTRAPSARSGASARGARCGWPGPGRRAGRAAAPAPARPAGGGIEAEPEPIRLTAADRRMVGQGDDLGRPEVVRMDFKDDRPAARAVPGGHRRALPGPGRGGPRLHLPRAPGLGGLRARAGEREVPDPAQRRRARRAGGRPGHPHARRAARLRAGRGRRAALSPSPAPARSSPIRSDCGEARSRARAQAMIGRGRLEEAPVGRAQAGPAPAAGVGYRAAGRPRPAPRVGTPASLAQRHARAPCSCDPSAGRAASGVARRTALRAMPGCAAGVGHGRADGPPVEGLLGLGQLVVRGGQPLGGREPVEPVSRLSWSGHGAVLDRPGLSPSRPPPSRRPPDPGRCRSRATGRR